MLKFILPLSMLALSACVVAQTVPYQGGFAQQPEEYDLPAHCNYNAYGDIICQ